MKKTVILLVAAMSLMIACTKSNEAEYPVGEKVSVNIIADVTTNGITKAVADGDGKGIYANQCHLQIWWGDKLYYEKTAAVTNFTANFNDIVLVRDQNYDFLFWADNKAGAYYDTSDLRNVRIVGSYVGGNDARDAFYGSIINKYVEKGFTETVELRRPFAQLNVITTDINSLYEQFSDMSQYNAAIPQSITLSVTVPTEFNVKTGAASEMKELKYTSSLYASPLNTAKDTRNTLSMDYFFAPDGEGMVVDIDWAANSTSYNEYSVSQKFTNIPLHRNYRTNIIGNLITVKGSVTVEIYNEWDQEINK